MIGGGGGWNYMSIPSYGTPGSAGYAQSYDSTGETGSAFFNRRLSLAQTVGVNYQYTRSIMNFSGGSFETQMHSVMPFFSYAPGAHFSANIAAGPQYYSESAAAAATSSSAAYSLSLSAWTPAVTASFGWQTARFSVSASLSRAVTAGDGLVGSYISESASLHARDQIARDWTVDLSGAYSDFTGSASQGAFAYPGGHTIDGEILLDHTLGRHFHAEIGYQRMYMNYFGGAAQTYDPNSDRAYATISYQFTRPIGR